MTVCVVSATNKRLCIRHRGRTAQLVTELGQTPAGTIRRFQQRQAGTTLATSQQFP